MERCVSSMLLHAFTRGSSAKPVPYLCSGNLPQSRLYVDGHSWFGGTLESCGHGTALLLARAVQALLRSRAWCHVCALNL